MADGGPCRGCGLDYASHDPAQNGGFQSQHDYVPTYELVLNVKTGEAKRWEPPEPPKPQMVLKKRPSPPPRRRCPECGGHDLEWAYSQFDGSVYIGCNFCSATVLSIEIMDLVTQLDPQMELKGHEQ